MGKRSQLTVHANALSCAGGVLQDYVARNNCWVKITHNGNIATLIPPYFYVQIRIWSTDQQCFHIFLSCIKDDTIIRLARLSYTFLLQKEDYDYHTQFKTLLVGPSSLWSPDILPHIVFGRRKWRRILSHKLFGK